MRRVVVVPLAAALVACGSSATSPTGGTSPASGTAVGWGPVALIARAGPPLTDFFDGTYPPRLSMSLPPDGNGWLVWDRRQPARIEASRRRPSGWQDAITVREVSGSDQIFSPAVDLASDGRVLVAWKECCRPGIVVMATIAPGDGSWPMPSQLSDTPEGFAVTRGRGDVRPDPPRAFVPSSSGGVVLWDQITVDRDFTPFGNFPSLFATRYDPILGWRRAALLSAEHEYTRPFSATMLPGGQVLLAWVGSGGVHLRQLGDEEWPPPEFLAEGNSPAIAASRSGYGAIAYFSRASLVSQDFQPGSGWQPAQTVASLSSGPASPHLAVGGSGDRLILWSDSRGISESHAAARGSWSERRSLYGPGARVEALEADDGGNAIGVWSEPRGSEPPRLIAARFEPATGWQEPRILQEEGVPGGMGSAALRFDAAGNGFLAWSMAVSSGSEIRGAEYRVRR